MPARPKKRGRMKVSDSLSKATKNQADALMAGITGALAVIFSSGDGFDVAASARNPDQVVRMAAMASSISAIGSVIGQETMLGSHRGITIAIERGYVVMVEVPHPQTPMILSVVADTTAVLGQLNYMAREAASAIAALGA
jgi:uncharacterized protein